ncbi:3-deoxy-manno-octulosonate cytidylyltransferase [Dissulfurirhabdus thermomarina]|uniref:3-deoxy-manno-octulosonate cytidylyltransferase n=1 Tax=Dissulfurirhabdus thermomarina TaxID=1765737 RepID=A0A6N9TQK0_DISTH|nr:3-deoxy-manno-octulosonate cytidylyltransferase [Dissulfurirhabdus thermomarina]NDY42730.1 3-deoxy-manno-octulosonate cytidylyltransferase [Dissulfurirhabdus thermomarina]NMX22563.1 3-deoxy-manno-octulosonate cytidylyltransferase [Dissulfurirhabdus thermomarina]
MPRHSSVVAVIPARYGSSRLPGKPLADIHGRPMILHVLERARAVACVDRVVVATDDARILDRVRGAGGEALLTRPEHPSGTDRIAEAVRALGLAPGDLVVNIQGDQPLLAPGPVEAIVRRLRDDPSVAMATPACPLDPAEADDPNRVKVVVDRRGRALYFSRARIPFDRDGEPPPEAAPAFLRHLGLYAYRPDFLQAFVALPRGPLERREKLEQLRALENGFAIGVEIVPEAPPEVDTAADLETVRRLGPAAGA